MSRVRKSDARFFNGLTETETNASASVAGLTPPAPPGEDALPVNRDPHAHWIPSADGLSFRNPAPNASAPRVPTSPTITLKVGGEFAPFHRDASHIDPGYRDGWNACFADAEAQISTLRDQVARLERELAQAIDERGERQAWCADESTRNRHLQRELDAIKAKLQDPTTVHVGMLRGDIAKPDLRSLLKVYGPGAVAQFDRGAAPLDVERLRSAAQALLDMYVEGAKSGDWGNWNPEEDDEVIALRQALTKETK